MYVDPHKHVLHSPLPRGIRPVFSVRQSCRIFLVDCAVSVDSGEALVVLRMADQVVLPVPDVPQSRLDVLKVGKVPRALVIRWCVPQCQIECQGYKS